MNVKFNGHLGDERVYLPRYEVENTPFYIQEGQCSPKVQEKGLEKNRVDTYYLHYQYHKWIVSLESRMDW